MSVVTALHIWPADREHPVAVEALICDFEGAQGDRHYGATMRSDTRQSKVYERGTVIRNHRQISIVDQAELARIADAMGLVELAPGTIADNICVTGVAGLTQLPPMTRLIFEGGAVIMTGGENLPCVIAGRMVANEYGGRAEAFPKAAMGLRGVTGWVEHPGTIRVGASITVASI